MNEISCGIEHRPKHGKITQGTKTEKGLVRYHAMLIVNIVYRLSAHHGAISASWCYNGGTYLETYIQYMIDW